MHIEKIYTFFVKVDKLYELYAKVLKQIYEDKFKGSFKNIFSRVVFAVYDNYKDYNAIKHFNMYRDKDKPKYIKKYVKIKVYKGYN